MTALTQIAAFVAQGCKIDDPLLCKRVQQAVTDVMGCILVGAKSDVAMRAQSALQELGPGTAPVYGCGKSFSPAFAALANATAAHAYDLDDWEEPGNTHPSAVLVPALLATATLTPMSGEEFLRAYATGFEVIARVGNALTLPHYAKGFHTTATLGTLGAAAAVAHARGLDPERAGHALSLAVSQAIGYTGQFGTNAKPAQAGFAAKSGIICALMAQEGVTAQPHILDGERGMNGLLGAGNQGTFRDAIAKLGAPPALVEYGIMLKAWPSCGYTHRTMTCALDFRAQYPGKSSEIVDVRITMPDFHKEILPFANPKDADEALFSVEACLAQVLVTGDQTPDDLKNGFWQNSEVQRLIACTKVHTEKPQNPALNYDPNQPERVDITLRSSEHIHLQCAYPIGALANPMSDQHLASKFCDLSGRDDRTFNIAMDWPTAANIVDHFQDFGDAP
ncbi:MAG: MmgE/PrpD family protein [Hyphomicrobiales bacterium]